MPETPKYGSQLGIPTPRTPQTPLEFGGGERAGLERNLLQLGRELGQASYRTGLVEQQEKRIAGDTLGASLLLEAESTLIDGLELLRNSKVQPRDRIAHVQRKLLPELERDTAAQAKDPFAHKYVQTHLRTYLQGHVNSFTSEMRGLQREMDRSNIFTSAGDFMKSAADEDTLEGAAMKIGMGLDMLKSGMEAGVITGDELRKAYIDGVEETYTSVLSKVIRNAPIDFIQARQKGKDAVIAKYGQQIYSMRNPEAVLQRLEGVANEIMGQQHRAYTIEREKTDYDRKQLSSQKRYPLMVSAKALRFNEAIGRTFSDATVNRAYEAGELTREDAEAILEEYYNSKAFLERETGPARESRRQAYNALDRMFFQPDYAPASYKYELLRLKDDAYDALTNNLAEGADPYTALANVRATYKSRVLQLQGARTDEIFHQLRQTRNVIPAQLFKGTEVGAPLDMDKAGKLLKVKPTMAPLIRNYEDTRKFYEHLLSQGQQRKELQETP